VGPDNKEKIMKKSMILVLTVLTLSLFAFSEVKIGVVSGQDVLQKTKKGQSIRTKLENLGKAKQTQIENLEKEIVALQKDLSSPALNTETKEKKSRELEDKKISYQRVVQDAQKEFQAQQQKEMMTMYNEIMPLIQDLGKSKGFTLILDVASSGIAYFDPSIDITNDVIKAVDAKFPQ
jgi:outer membrane protein